MPYQSLSQLPDTVQHVLPLHARDIYKEAFNNAFEQYKARESRRGGASREVVAHRVAWAAVKQKYEKSSSGKWHLKR